MSTTRSGFNSTASAYEGGSGIVSAANHSGTGRVAALDGVRALAILWVLIHNVGSPDAGASGVPLKIWILMVNAGWVGVQLFFALSGFLITRILLAAKGGEGWIGHFYARRLLRIVPLYYAFLMFMLFVAPHLEALGPLHPHDTRSSLWYWTYLVNWAAPFGGVMGTMPHVWSLAVEEQFYLAWPLLVAAWSDRTLAISCLLMTLSALFMRAAVHLMFPGEVGSAAAYELTIARWDTIALGALVAIALRHSRVRELLARNLVHIVGVVLSGLLLLTVVQRGLPARGWVTELVGQPLTGIASATLVLACVVTGGLTTRGARLQRTLVGALSTAPLRTIGKYSYAIYIFHSPVHRVLHEYAVTWLNAGGGTQRFCMHIAYSALVLAISLAFARVSWLLLEQPFLALKRYVPMPSASGPSGGANGFSRGSSIRPHAVPPSLR